MPRHSSDSHVVSAGWLTAFFLLKSPVAVLMVCIRYARLRRLLRAGLTYRRRLSEAVATEVLAWALAPQTASACCMVLSDSIIRRDLVVVRSLCAPLSTSRIKPHYTRIVSFCPACTKSWEFHRLKVAFYSLLREVCLSFRACFCCRSRGEEETCPGEFSGLTRLNSTLQRDAAKCITHRVHNRETRYHSCDYMAFPRTILATSNTGCLRLCGPSRHFNWAV